MPGSTGVVQEAGVPRRPSISTRQRRQEPKASRLSVAQSFGTLVPISMAGRMIEVPAGTVTGWPSISSGTSWVAILAGVPEARSLIGGMRGLLLRGDPRGWTIEIFREVLHGARHGQRRQAAEGAEGAVEHGGAEVVEQREVRGPILIRDDAVDHLDAAGRADAA